METFVITRVIKALLGSLGRMAASIFAFLRAIPTPVYAASAGAVALLLAWSLLTTRADLRQTRRDLVGARQAASRSQQIASNCKTTLDGQTRAFTQFRQASTTASQIADNRLKAAQARAKQAQVQINRLKSRPEPAPDQQCPASEALLNEALS